MKTVKITIEVEVHSDVVQVAIDENGCVWSSQSKQFYQGYDEDGCGIWCIHERGISRCRISNWKDTLTDVK
jgi:hypothetical protein